MHTIDLLEEALWLARQAGWEVRQELLDSGRGGVCRLGNKHLLFIDRSLPAAEQLEQVMLGLRWQLTQPGDAFASGFRTCLEEHAISSELLRSLGL